MLRASLIVGCSLAGVLAAGPCASRDLRDLYFGEALYQANQGRYFEALERLDAELALHKGVDEPQRDSLQFHIGEAEFSVGDFELYYRMHLRAGRAIKAVLEGAVDESVRNEAAYRLARIHFQKDQAADALLALDRISGKVPVAIRDDVEFLRANVYMALGRPAEAAGVLKRLQSAQSLTGFAAYNLGIAMLQEGREQDAILQLDKAGQLSVSTAGPLAIRDKSNMLLGKLMLESTDFTRAQQYFDRVRLDGPFSNQALLSAGWADVSAQNFERAVVPWGMLAKREVTDAAVQEAMLALPYAYSKLNVHGRAAVLYGDALKSFGEELTKVDASMKSIAEGRFLKALVREEIQQDKGWAIRLRTLPDAPETYYLMQLMASNDFQTALQNYLDLDELRKKMASWQTSLDAYEDMIRLRRKNYEPLLPGVDAQFRELDAQIRLRMEQRNHLQQRLHQLLIEPRPDLLATADERIAMEQLRAVEQAMEKANGADVPQLQEKLHRLKGVITWTLYTSYPQRLTEAHEHLNALNADIAVLNKQYQEFVRARQAAEHSYLGYDDTIKRLRTRAAESLENVNKLMAQQGHLIEIVAIDELKTRRARLEVYQTQARYAVADSYDRAAKAQGNEAPQPTQAATTTGGGQ
ncbi:MAG TPA: tetratricopeptide repeat protein [Steroidobacteraceae bacterium]|nr:tetratricopeptide repeat protein [Steroidobacteraceae bacterium]